MQPCAKLVEEGQGIIHINLKLMASPGAVQPRESSIPGPECVKVTKIAKPLGNYSSVYFSP